MRCFYKKLLILLLFSSYPALAFSHGMVHDQIYLITLKINASPLDTKLLIKRGRLHIEDGSYHAANSDFIQTLQLNPKNRTAHYYLGYIALKTKNYSKAVLHTKDFISMLNKESGALTRGYRLLGDSYDAQNKYKQAAIAYQTAINFSQEPRPSFFLELATTYQKQRQYSKALKAIDQGIHRLGSLPVLEQHALNIEIATSSYENALQRVNKLINQGQLLPKLYEQKGHILEKAMRRQEAQQAYKLALTELDKLPTRRKHTLAIRTLRKKLQTNLKKHP